MLLLSVGEQRELFWKFFCKKKRMIEREKKKWGFMFFSSFLETRTANHIHSPKISGPIDSLDFSRAFFPSNNFASY